MGRLWNTGPRLAGGRINAVKGRIVGGRTPLAINQHLQFLKFSHKRLHSFSLQD
jgi:hypothetical protein